jgi:hypothetical protein
MRQSTITRMITSAMGLLILSGCGTTHHARVGDTADWSHGTLRFEVSPTSTVYPFDDDDMFRTGAIEFRAQLTNAGSAPLKVSLIDIGNITIESFTRDNNAVPLQTRSVDVRGGIASMRKDHETLLPPGATATFVIHGVQENAPRGSDLIRSARSERGTYTLVFGYCSQAIGAFEAGLCARSITAKSVSFRIE